MDKKLVPERLQAIRQQLGLNKKEAADLVQLTKMGYGRYESGERNPIFHSTFYMALMMETSVGYLTGEAEDPAADMLLVRREEDPALFALVSAIRSREPAFQERLLTYCRMLLEQENREQGETGN